MKASAPCVICWRSGTTLEILFPTVRICDFSELIVQEWLRFRVSTTVVIGIVAGNRGLAS